MIKFGFVTFKIAFHNPNFTLQKIVKIHLDEIKNSNFRLRYHSGNFGLY